MCDFMRQSTAATSVEIRFHLDSADWIPKWIREKIKEKVVNSDSDSLRKSNRIFYSVILSI